MVIRNQRQPTLPARIFHSPRSTTRSRNQVTQSSSSRMQDSTTSDDGIVSLTIPARKTLSMHQHQRNRLPVRLPDAIPQVRSTKQVSQDPCRLALHAMHKMHIDLASHSHPSTPPIRSLPGPISSPPPCRSPNSAPHSPCPRPTPCPSSSPASPPGIHCLRPRSRDTARWA